MNDNLKQIFISILNLPKDQVDDSISTKTCQRWDSIAHINLMLAVEQQYDSFFTPEEMQEMTSYHKIVSVLKAKGALSE